MFNVLSCENDLFDCNDVVSSEVSTLCNHDITALLLLSSLSLSLRDLNSIQNNF